METEDEVQTSTTREKEFLFHSATWRTYLSLWKRVTNNFDNRMEQIGNERRCALPAPSPSSSSSSPNCEAISTPPYSRTCI